RCSHRLPADQVEQRRQPLVGQVGDRVHDRLEEPDDGRRVHALGLRPVHPAAEHAESDRHPQHVLQDAHSPFPSDAGAVVDSCSRIVSPSCVPAPSVISSSCSLAVSLPRSNSSVIFWFPMRNHPSSPTLVPPVTVWKIPNTIPMTTTKNTTRETIPSRGPFRGGAISGAPVSRR